MNLSMPCVRSASFIRQLKVLLHQQFNNRAHIEASSLEMNETDTTTFLHLHDELADSILRAYINGCLHDATQLRATLCEDADPDIVPINWERKLSLLDLCIRSSGDSDTVNGSSSSSSSGGSGSGSGSSVAPQGATDGRGTVLYNPRPLASIMVDIVSAIGAYVNRASTMSTSSSKGSGKVAIYAVFGTLGLILIVSLIVYLLRRYFLQRTQKRKILINGQEVREISQP